MDTPDQIPDFANTPRMRWALKRAVSILRDERRISQNKQAADAITANVPITADILSDIIARDRTPRDPRVPDFWAWLRTSHYSDLLAAWEESKFATLGSNSPLVNSLHDFFTPDKPLNVEKLTFLDGEYAVFRPFFLDKTKYMVSKMRCGIEGDFTRFNMDIAYVGADGTKYEELVTGHMVPYQNTVLFLGKIEKTKAAFVFILVNFPQDSLSEKALSAEGVVMIGMDGTTPSGYPIAIRRLRGDIEPTVMDVETFRREISTPDLLLNILNRGITNWTNT